MKTKLIFIISIITTCLLSFVFFVFLFFAKPQPKPLPIIAQVNEFSLTDSLNKPFHSTNLKGKIWVAHFFFTTCAGVCPITTGQLASIFRSYNLDKRVEFVSMTVNPDNDTPEVLSKFAQKYKADPKQWHFLTGPVDTIQNIAINTFKVGTKGEPVFHSTYFILVDPQGQIRGYYDGLDRQNTAKLFRDIAFLLKEMK